MRPVLLGLLLALASAPGTAEAAYCYQGWTTGYVRTEHSSRTFDGTSIYTDEPIAAAGWDIPIDSVAVVSDIGRFRVADRGRLAPGQIDVAVWTRAEAYSITGTRRVCIYPPGEAPDVD
jgi:hypothetical protein